MHPSLRFLLLPCVLALVVGCASKIKPVGPEMLPFPEGAEIKEVNRKGFRLRIESQDSLRPFIQSEEVQRELGRRKSEIQPPTVLADGETSRGIVFILAPPVWDSPKGFHEDRERGAKDVNKDPDLALAPTREDHLLFTLRERLYRYLLRAYPYPVRTRYAYRLSDPLIQKSRMITIETRITDIKRGDAWIRYVIGYGLGQSRIQIQGEILEGLERRKIGDFVIRRGHGGFSQSGLNPEVLMDDYALKYAIEASVRIICEELPEVLPGVTIEAIVPEETTE
ncbi:hypothetical protein GC173_03990 [bacterium]|nr:hypothetical protein [bacterium]